jgi:hypothetical protein
MPRVRQPIITINVPVVFMARYVIILRGATSLRGALEGVGPENRDFLGLRSCLLGPKKSRFSGPTPSNAPSNDVAPLKIITYRAIKTTGTLVVYVPECCCVVLLCVVVFCGVLLCVVVCKSAHWPQVTSLAGAGA